jgi:hypothetical protein
MAKRDNGTSARTIVAAGSIKIRGPAWSPFSANVRGCACQLVSGVNVSGPSMSDVFRSESRSGGVRKPARARSAAGVRTGLGGALRCARGARPGAAAVVVREGTVAAAGAAALRDGVDDGSPSGDGGSEWRVAAGDSEGRVAAGGVEICAGAAGGALEARTAGCVAELLPRRWAGSPLGAARGRAGFKARSMAQAARRFSTRSSVLSIAWRRAAMAAARWASPLSRETASMACWM